MIIQSRRIWIAGQFIPAQIVVEGDKIAAIHTYEKYTADIDYQNRRIVPGFIDIHTHGAYGFDTNDADKKGLKNWIKNIPKEGVTSLLPTTVTQEPAALIKALKNIASVVKEGYNGAEILGVHLEGPFLDLQYRGAQPTEAIAKPTIEQFALFQDAAEGLIKYITLAPEHDEDFALTKYCRAAGVVVSMGHSSATCECALMGIANGATSVTHVYNGMSPFHHREPGLAGIALRAGNTYGEIISDGRHCHLAAAAVFYQAKGKDYAIMVSDSLSAKYCPPGTDCRLGSNAVEPGADGLARLKGTDIIAGSTLCINEGLKLMVEGAMVPFDAALNSCTGNPAKCLGIYDRKGKLTAGYDADIVVLEDDYKVCQTYCRGNSCL